MRSWIGRWVIGVGVLHTLAGVALFAPQLRELLAAGLWNALGDRDPMRNLAFWFFFGGAYVMLIGALAHWIERATGGPLPRVFAWTLLATTALGACMAPASGFWLLLVPALAALRRPAASLPPQHAGHSAVTDLRAVV